VPSNLCQDFDQSVWLLLQEIKAVDRVFPALDQVEMQLACRRVLAPVLSTSSEVAAKPDPEPLQMAQSQTATATEESKVNGVPSNGDKADAHQPEWLQDRGDLDSWILKNLNDGQRRLKMVKDLTNLALPFQYGASKVMQALGDLYSENVS